MGGFDLTTFGVRPQQPVREQQPVQQSQPAPATPPPVVQQPGIPQTLDEALHTPIHGEVGYQDKLSKNDPVLKSELWSVDKFVEPGGLPKDKNGNILIKAPPSTEEDKKQINYHE